MYDSFCKRPPLCFETTGSGPRFQDNENKRTEPTESGIKKDCTWPDCFLAKKQDTQAVKKWTYTRLCFLGFGSSVHGMRTIPACQIVSMLSRTHDGLFRVVHFQTEAIRFTPEVDVCRDLMSTITMTKYLITRYIHSKSVKEVIVPLLFAL